jgi:hypothetical protein
MKVEISTKYAGKRCHGRLRKMAGLETAWLYRFPENVISEMSVVKWNKLSVPGEATIACLLANGTSVLAHEGASAFLKS